MTMCLSEGLQLTFHFIIRSFEEMFLLTATEVILGTAIIMGLSALVTILLRICSRSRISRNSRNIQNPPDEFGRTGIRISLTSLQQRVMSKLRDRPPRYETRHNYEYQRRERGTRIPVLNPAAATMSNDIPPPSYEAGDVNSVRSTQRILYESLNLYFQLPELPPAYTIAIEDTGGIINHSFTSDESAIRGDDGSANNRSDINTASRTSDNVLHIQSGLTYFYTKIFLKAY